MLYTENRGDLILRLRITNSFGGASGPVCAQNKPDDIQISQDSSAVSDRHFATLIHARFGAST